MNPTASFPIIRGAGAAAALLGLWAAAVSLVSGWNFMLEQLAAYWYFIVSLAIGFGVQFGLYAYLRSRVRTGSGKSIVATTGTTSTVAMVSCCTHYLANILPIIGAAGIASFVGQYQIEFF